MQIDQQGGRWETIPGCTYQGEPILRLLDGSDVCLSQRLVAESWGPLRPEPRGPEMISNLRAPAIRIRQGDRDVYSFTVNGRDISDFAAVSRVRRDPAASLQGYQRPEAINHVRGIRKYVESPGAILPNAIVVAFNDDVRFEPVGDGPFGHIVIPHDPDGPEHERPAWLVDGQQRTAALRDADVAEFPVAVVGFHASEAEQRTQFILVNSTKPLPKGLIHELLPGTDGLLPAAHARKQLPSLVLAKLNQQEPFAGRIKTPTASSGYIQDNSVLAMIEHSLAHGSLYDYLRTGGEPDVDGMVRHLVEFWGAVAATWPEAWELPPRQSRLTHGVGIKSLGYVMDWMAEAELAEGEDLRVSLKRLVPHVAWTSGVWKLRYSERPWNKLENTSSSIYDLVAHLLDHVKAKPSRR